MIRGNCKDNIRSRLSGMTNTEKKLAEYILEHYEDVLSCSVSELARKAEVSDASVTRFCRSVGYKGYQDFKMNAATDLLPGGERINPILERGDGAQAIADKIFSAYQNVLANTLWGLDSEAASAAARKLFEAEHLLIVGTGGSAAIARDAQHKFLKVGIKAECYDDSDMQLMSASLMKECDAVLCISYSGSNRQVIDCIREAKANGAYIAGIISQAKTPLGKLADEVFYASYDQTIFQSESLSTRFAQLAIVDLLVSLVSFCDYEASYEAIQTTREATAGNKY